MEGFDYGVMSCWLETLRHREHIQSILAAGPHNHPNRPTTPPLAVCVRTANLLSATCPCCHRPRASAIRAALLLPLGEEGGEGRRKPVAAATRSARSTRPAARSRQEEKEKGDAIVSLCRWGG